MNNPSTELTPKQKELSDLFNKEATEQAYQAFLEQNTCFLPREFIQNHGIRNNLVISKLKLGSELITDFAYLAASSDDFNIVLVELEKPHSKFFKPGAKEFHEDFNQALAQINTWRAWLAVSGNERHLIEEKLEPLIHPHQHRAIRLKYVLVFGRRAEYVDSAERRNLVRAVEREDFKIITYDSLLENPKTDTVYIAKRKSDHFEILTTEFIDDTVFAWMSTDQLRINPGLRSDAEAKRTNWRSLTSENGRKIHSMEKALRDIKNA